MTLQECKEEAAKQWFWKSSGIVADYRTLSNGVKCGNIKQRNLESVLDDAAELYASQFNKPPVYGQRVIDEIEQLRKMANHAPDNEYKVGFLKAITNVKAILNEYAPSPGSVDVDEKKEYCDGTFYCSLDSTYNSDGTCGGCGKKKRNGVDGLGDSSGSVENQEQLWKEVFHQSGSRMDFMQFLQKHFTITRKP